LCKLARARHSSFCLSCICRLRGARPRGPARDLALTGRANARFVLSSLHTGQKPTSGNSTQNAEDRGKETRKTIETWHQE
jgi:hypothetical protein